AGVVGVPITADKTLIVACIVPAEPAPDLAAVRSHVERALAAYKRPHEYRIVASLPRTANGKLQRRELRDRLLREMALDPTQAK
ncbi:MAG TPA: hypothetical protein VNL92_04945, partial [Dehalococcoidia bacterium]|nr:hypothetical protein [Dehalococcoidia bacterium]